MRRFVAKEKRLNLTDLTLPSLIGGIANSRAELALKYGKR